MLAVHGSWMPASPDHPARLALWGEVGGWRAAARGRKSAGSLPRHPCAAPVERLAGMLARPEAASDPVALGLGQAVVRLPSSGEAPLPSPDLPVSRPDTARATLAWWSVPVATAAPGDALALLLALNDERLPPEVVLGADLRFWSAAARFACDLLVRQRLLPALERQGGAYRASWRPALDEEHDAARLATLARAMPPACRALAWEADTPAPAPRALLLSFLNVTLDAAAREAAREAPRAGMRVPPAGGRRRGTVAVQPSLAEAWIEALFGDPVLRGDPGQLAAFYEQYRAWSSAARAAGASDTFRVCFRLDPPEPAPDSEGLAALGSGRRDWALTYMLQATDDPSLLVPARDVWQQRGDTARFLNHRLGQPQERLLAALGQAALLFPPIEGSLRTARPEVCALSAAEAYAFLREAAPLLQANGFVVLAPRLGLRFGGKSSGNDGGPTFFGWDTVDYGEPLNREEFEALAQIKEPLVQVRGRWVELRPEQREQMLAFFAHQGRDGRMALAARCPWRWHPTARPACPLKTWWPRAGWRRCWAGSRSARPGRNSTIPHLARAAAAVPEGQPGVAGHAAAVRPGRLPG